MFVLDGNIVTSASDLSVASKCEFAFLRTIDARLGRIELPETAEDAMLTRTSTLGDEHERRVLDRYRSRFGDRVAEIDRPDLRDPDALSSAVRATAEAFESAAEVVFQATFFDGSFVGFADFIVRQADGSYEVQDSKLARTARVTALLQLAAYAEQLERSGVPIAPTVRLILGDGRESVHLLSDIAPVYRNRRHRLLRIIGERFETEEPICWGDPRYTACGHCELCDAEVQASRDVLLVAGMRVSQRDRLVQAGIRTIDELAASTGTVAGIAPGSLDGMREQAKLQINAQEGTPPPMRVMNPSALAVLPDPDDGDIFFDFEGDPLYTEDGQRWGLDYLFGFIDARGSFTPIWAHTLSEERDALRRFLDEVARRRADHPGLHIYHYAPYEKTHLLSIAARHGIGEDEVDQLLRENVLVDLYPIVRKALRVGSRSYSIKKLEPLYMEDSGRTGDVQTAAASIDEYVQACELIRTGSVAEGRQILDSIAEYNEYDCLSTLRLRDWLLAIAADHAIPIGVPAVIREIEDAKPSPVRDALLELAGDPLDPNRSNDQTAYALAAAALDYYSREGKGFWQEHYSRLIQPIEEWADTRDVLVVEDAEIVQGWHRPPRAQLDRRELRLTGQLAPGSTIREGDKPFLLYEHPGPYSGGSADPGARSAREVLVQVVSPDGSFTVLETLPRGAEQHDLVPSALTPASPPNAKSQQAAIAEWATNIAEIGGAWPAEPMSDLLRRLPPRTRSGVLAPVVDDDAVGACVSSLLDLEHSYLAVQGPPGTGKTYLAAHVIARLVRDHQWKIGVVAQSHQVVENLLAKIVDAGLDSGLVGKKRKQDDPGSPAPFTFLPDHGHIPFVRQNAATGFVLGGTSWDLSNPDRFPRKLLDLLVVDEAGQFSLGGTVASSVAARNLLLLGDPQQLPQVSQASHPEPIDESALGWVSAGHDVLPPRFGYFLPESRRMDAALVEPVSELAYEGRLRAHPITATRSLTGIAPGLHPVPVDHAGNSTESIEEASVIVSLVGGVMGTEWTDPAAGRFADPLGQQDIIVVTPYNAQAAAIRSVLDAAGFSAVRAGTADKFQGQEAVVTMVSLAASSPAEVPRGMSFLIMKNRLNVAISRAQWAAYFVYSPELAEYLPGTPSGVAELSSFIRLIE